MAQHKTNSIQVVGVLEKLGDEKVCFPFSSTIQAAPVAINSLEKNKSFYLAIQFTMF